MMVASGDGGDATRDGGRLLRLAGRTILAVGQNSCGTPFAGRPPGGYPAMMKAGSRCAFNGHVNGSLSF